MKRKTLVKIEELLQLEESSKTPKQRRKADENKNLENCEEERKGKLEEGESGKVETSRKSLKENESVNSDDWEIVIKEEESDSEIFEKLPKRKSSRRLNESKSENSSKSDSTKDSEDESEPQSEDEKSSQSSTKNKPNSKRKTTKKTSQEKLKLNPKVQNVTIPRNSILAAMKMLAQPKQKFDKRKREVAELSDNCYCKYPKDITYETKYYYMKHLKESILNRKWELLPDLLDLFMNSISLFEYKKYQSYFVELTHMILQIHANFGSTDILEKFTKRFFIPLRQDQNLTPFDVWYFED